MTDFLAPDEPVVESILLDGADRASSTWQKLKKHLEARLHQLRVKNDNDNQKLTEADTAALRGQIAAIKNLLAQGTPAPADEAHED